MEFIINRSIKKKQQLLGHGDICQDIFTSACGKQQLSGGGMGDKRGWGGRSVRRRRSLFPLKSLSNGTLTAL